VLLVDEMGVERQNERPLIELKSSMIRHQTRKLGLSAKKVYAPNSSLVLRVMMEYTRAQNRYRHIDVSTST
jgi:hypothetical protein